VALELEDRWVWDFWIAKDSRTYHLFFLQAPRSLGNPELRHRNASVGHATSPDLVDWTEVGTAIEAGFPGEWDDIATWTGSVIQHAGRWWMFYSGSASAEDGLIQRIGAAVSDDLNFWVKHPSNPLLGAHPYWYERLDSDVWFDEAWRDPWVYPIEDGFEMLLTARVKTGPTRERGVVARAFSTDLSVWSALPPLTEPGGFGQMEVPQRLSVDGGDLLLFSCQQAQLASGRAAAGDPRSDCYALWLDGERNPYSARNAFALDLPNLYGVRAVQDPGGRWVVLGFVLEDETGEFAGRISDPIPLDAVMPRSIRLTRD
jgi:beta-fructofuranosidase